MISYIKKYWLYAILAPLFMAGEVAMDLLQPRYMSKIIDEGVLGLSNNQVGDMNLVLSLGVQMLLIVMVGVVTGVLSGVFANLCSQNFGNDVRKDCFKRMMSFSFEQTDSFSTGSLITRVTNDITQVQNLVTQSIRGFVRTIILFFGGIVCMFLLNFYFGILVICVAPFILGSIFFIIKKAYPNFNKLQKKLDRLNSVMQENIGGSRVVKAYVKENYEQGRFQAANDDLVNIQLKVLKFFAFTTPITNILLNISIVVVIKIGGIQVEQGNMSPGNVMAAITYLSLIMQSILMFAMIFQSVSRGTASGQRLQEVLDCKPAIIDGNDKESSNTKGKIEFKNVSFSYPNSTGGLILKKINLVIESGETLGILGMTGSGKSTLVNLIPRFYEATQGQVLVDGVDVKEYALETLRDKISIALQKSELFHDSIKGNIKWGKPKATDQEVRDAAVAAQAEGFIEGKPEKFDTMVSERGTSLSGGQKQRIAISRALLKNAEILIFDDSTSALDLKTEALLYEKLKTRYQNTTKIIIAQRVASVMGASRIAIIENGEIVACDSHKELIESCEIYQDIYNSQLKGGGTK